MKTLHTTNWVEQHGGILHINEGNILPAGPVVIDLEFEENSLTGVGFTENGRDIFYYDKMDDTLKIWLSHASLVGHNLKGDMHWLKQLGVNVTADQIYDDTMIQSYIVNTTKRSHGLKNLAKEFFGITWSTYKEMIGKGKNQMLLKDQDISRQANYNGMDVMTTYMLWKYFSKHMTIQQTKIYKELELPIYRLLYKIEEKGVMINTDLLESLDREFGTELLTLQDKLHSATNGLIRHLSVMSESWYEKSLERIEKNGKFSFTSWQQKRILLNALGIHVTTTDKKELIKHASHPVVKMLLEHSELSKLQSTFIGGLQKIPTLPVVHTAYNQVTINKEGDQVGIRSGRLSSKGPNLQQVPKRSERGKRLRHLFIPRPGHIMLGGDYDQIELRLAAHFSQEPILIRAFEEGKDPHQRTADAIGVDREAGKQANYLLTFGGSHWRLANALNISEFKAEKVYDDYWNTFTKLRSWKELFIRESKRYGGITTLANRFIPIPELKSEDFEIRMGAERQAVSYLIQGSAADIMKLAMLECESQGYIPILTTHDELEFEICAGTQEEFEYIKLELKDLMESTTKISVPLTVKIKEGMSWGECH